MNTCEKKGQEVARVGRMFHGLPAVASELNNGHGGKGVSWRHLKMVLIGNRESASLLAQVRERFPQLLPPNGQPWNKADETSAEDGAPEQSAAERRPAPHGC